MRNDEYLDAIQPEDEYISELMVDEDGQPYRLVCGDKIIQIEENTQSNIDMNLIINRDRVVRKTKRNFTE